MVMAPPSIRRRRFLGVLTAGAAAASCSGADEESPSQEEEAAGTPNSLREAPVLAERVAAGDLPPVEERLPKEPYVIRPGALVAQEFLDPRPGTYGGTIQLAQQSPNGDPSIFVGVVEGLLWAPNGLDFGDGVEGNVVAGYEANGDDTVFTFHMREGLRWSDGEPVTIEDVEFAFEDVLNNEEITPIFPLYLRAGRRGDAAPAVLEVIDEWTFSLTFDAPYGAFPVNVAIANWASYADIIKPRHYLEQFHPKYAAKEQLRQLLNEASVPEDQWFNLFNAKQLVGGGSQTVTTEGAVGHPTLNPWMIAQVQAEAFTYERNPYYHKVDTEGKQLPYIDGIRSQVVQDKETLTSRALFGEFDFLGERASARQLPLISEKADAGEVSLWIYPKQTVLTSFYLNLTHPDENWRTVVRDVRFRRALDLAINRDEIIENFYLGEFGEVPTKIGSGEYNVDEANRLLDEMGLAEKDGEGFRLGPDGNQFRVPFELQDHAEETIPMGELIAEHWKSIGVFTTVRQVDAGLAAERHQANEIKAGTGPLARHLWKTGGWTDYLPGQSFGILWEEWYITQGEKGEEPPDEVKQLFEEHGRLVSAPVGSSESQAALDAIVQNHYENIWNFNPVEWLWLPTFWTSRVKNVPQGVEKQKKLFGIIVTMSMEQWYIDE